MKTQMANSSGARRLVRAVGMEVTGEMHLEMRTMAKTTRPVIRTGKNTILLVRPSSHSYVTTLE